jgi:hypothetical protein
LADGEGLVCHSRAARSSRPATKAGA